jgi:transcriptional regulator with XRE-family HTH domain
MTPKSPLPAQTEVTRRVRNLRVALKLTQEAFAAKMGVGRIAALYWESGRSQPSAEVYVRMAKAAMEIDQESAFWFWQQIGVDREALKDLLPEFKKSFDEAEQRVRVASQESSKGIVNVPILRGVGSPKEPLVARPEQIEGWFPLPAVLVPNPSRTSCIRAPKGMSALFGDDLVIVDVTPLPVEKLWGKIVIAIRHSTGTAYAGFLQKLELDNRQIRALSQLRLNEDFDFKHSSQITDMTNLSTRLTRQEKRTATDLLQLPGILLTMTPSSDWDLLGHAICWISYKDQGWLTAMGGTPEPM